MTNLAKILNKNQCQFQFQMILNEVCFEMINNLKIPVLIKCNKNIFSFRIEYKCRYYRYYYYYYYY